MTSEKQKTLNFKTIWIRYETGCSERHQLFLKEHSIRKQEPEYPRGKTLFLLNIPPYATEESIQAAFSNACGPVKSVTFSQTSSNTSRFKTGYIVFTRDQALNKALSLHQEFTLTLSTNNLPVLTGIRKWCKNYNESINNEKEIMQTVENYMNEYDSKVAKQLEQEKDAAEAVDDEGWTTVTGRKKRGQFALARKESTIQKVQFKEEEKKHKKQLLNFYTFQIREAKKQSLVELRKKFELDKKKLEQIKLKRKFKPF